jgi:hypothetical protein
MERRLTPFLGKWRVRATSAEVVCKIVPRNLVDFMPAGAEREPAAGLLAAAAGGGVI